MEGRSILLNETKRVIALGFFDGVHNGHAALMRRTVQVAQEIGATPSAFTYAFFSRN